MWLLPKISICFDLEMTMDTFPKTTLLFLVLILISFVFCMCLPDLPSIWVECRRFFFIFLSIFSLAKLMGLLKHILVKIYTRTSIPYACNVFFVFFLKNRRILISVPWKAMRSIVLIHQADGNVSLILLTKHVWLLCFECTNLMPLLFSVFFFFLQIPFEWIYHECVKTERWERETPSVEMWQRELD